MNKLLATLGGAVIASTMAAGSASAYVVNIDNFQVTKNSNVILDDPFDDNLAPPDGPNGAATYGTGGTFSESGGTAEMTTATGGTHVFGGTTFVRHRAIFRTNTQPLEVNTLGLKSDDTISVQGLFNMAIPTQERESYGVILTDRLGTNGSINPGDDELEMRVVMNQDGNVRIQFAHVDYVTETTNGIQSILLTDAVTASALADISNDQILLQLDKLSAGSNDITASFEYFDNGVGLGLQTFTNTAAIFNGEDYTRAGFYAREPIPEPATFAVLVAGLAGLGFARRRRRAA